jgi:hypothetical protein
MNKPKKILAILSLGLGLSGLMAGTVSARPDTAGCYTLKQQCAAGNLESCTRWDVWNCWMCEKYPDAPGCRANSGGM